MKERLFSQPWISRPALGQAFCRCAVIPSWTGSVHERTFGIPLELRDHCGCIILRGTGAHRIGREGVDVWITIDLAPPIP